MRRTFPIALFAILLFLSVAGVSSAGEGHGAAKAGHEFRIGNAKVMIALEPSIYVKGRHPRVLVTVADHASATPILDADLSILFEPAGAAPQHGGHGEGHGAGTDSTPTEDGMLDFGEAPAAELSVDLTTYTRLMPQQAAGVYAADYPLHGEGEYSYTLAVSRLGEKSFREPLLYGGTLVYQAESKARQYRMIGVIAVVLLSGGLAVWMLAARRRLGLRIGERMNILDIPWVRRFATSAWFQPAFQVPVLLFFLLIIGAGLFDVQKGDRNIATILMWTIWWAAIIFTFVLAGRVWCMMCPFGAAQDWIGRLVSLNKDFPKRMRNIYLPSLIFFGLTWWDGYSGIVNKPALTAGLLIAFFLVASAMALVFKGRAFCRYVCPIGGLIGIYSMFSPLELRNKCMEVCRDHRVKECIKGTDHSHGCPMFVTPMTLDRNNYCNFCSECIKSCSQKNIVVRFRSFAQDLWVSNRGYLDEALLAMVLVGITVVVTGEMVEPWHRWSDAVAGILPLEGLGFISHGAREKAVATFIFVAGSLVPPLLLLGVSGAVRRALPETELTVKKIFIQFAYMFIPVGIAMHLAHNISHLLLEGPGIVPAFERLLGMGAADATQGWTVTPLAGAETIFWLQMAVLMALNVFSLYAGYRISVRFFGDKALKAFIPMAILAVAFMVINAYILGQPMSLRHTH